MWFRSYGQLNSEGVSIFRLACDLNVAAHDTPSTPRRCVEPSMAQARQQRGRESRCFMDQYSNRRTLDLADERNWRERWRFPWSGASGLVAGQLCSRVYLSRISFMGILAGDRKDLLYSYADKFRRVRGLAHGYHLCHPTDV